MCAHHPHTRGFSLIEAVVAAAVVAIGLLGITSAYAAYVRSSASLAGSAQAMFLAEEGIESVKLMRDASWSATVGSFTAGVPYYLYFANGTWTATTTPQPEIGGEFNRTIVFSPVNRDVNGDITGSGGTLDPNTLLATVSVAFPARAATSTITLATYVDNIFKN